MPGPVRKLSKQVHREKFGNENKVKAFQDLIDWMLEHSDKYHVKITNIEEKPDQYTIYIEYWKKG